MNVPHLANPALLVLALALGTCAVGGGSKAQDASRDRDYVSGAPADPSQAWTLSVGGRLYDDWMDALGVERPTTTHPAWPAANTKRSGAVTWRCKSCHGWDYLGAAGAYRSGAYFTGIGGVRAMIGKDPADIIKFFSDGKHGFTDAMIPPEAKERLARFLSEGQHDASDYIDASGAAKGDAARGAAIFQNTCAACHGYDGRALGLGRHGDESVGAVAKHNPWELLHKIRNGQPGQNMISLRAFPVEDAADVLAYAQTLPAK